MLTFERANELFRYDPISGKLFWKKRTNNHMKEDLEAGSQDSRYGYLRVNIKGKSYAVHRVILVLSGIEVGDGLFVDHINHDRTDNRLENLRVVTKEQNTRNLSLYKKNETGYPGVYQHKTTKRYIAHIRVNNKKHHLGCFKTLEEAAAARAEAEIKYGFHPNHGL